MPNQARVWIWMCVIGCAACSSHGQGQASTDASVGVADSMPAHEDASFACVQACTSPPASHCVDATTLESSTSPGQCTSSGACDYPPTQQSCAFGCAAGECNPDPCAAVTCASPPAASCADANTLTTYAATGTCAQGACAYTPTTSTCPFGCANGTCASDPCAGVVCNQAPASICSTIFPNTLDTYGAGTCSHGTCTYAPTMQTCDFGCYGNACVTAATDACGICDRMWQCDAGLDNWVSIADSNGLGCADLRTGTTAWCNGTFGNPSMDMWSQGTWSRSTVGFNLLFVGTEGFGDVEVDCYPP